MKKWTKFLCCVLMIGFIAAGCLAGCSTVSNIKNKSKEVLYFGNSAVLVGDYLYYGNAYVDQSSFSGKSDYKSGAKKAYLARLKTSNLKATSEYYSPKNIENVSEEVVGHDNNFMFVLGQTIYYATPNQQKVSSDGSSSFNYNYTCIYKSNLNGNKKKKLYTTSSEIQQIEVLKSGKTYYIVMLAGDDLVKINLSTNKSQKIASDVNSVAMPKTYEERKVGSSLDFNGYIYYTTALENESGSGKSGNVVHRVKLSGGDSEVVYSKYSNITLLGREKDAIFFSETNTNAEIFLADASDIAKDVDIFRSAQRILTASSISDINTVYSTVIEDGESYVDARGYLFMNGSSLQYYDLRTKQVSNAITLSAGNSDLSSYSLLFVSGMDAYFATTTGIYKADISKVMNGGRELSCKTVVEFETAQIKNDNELYAFDGNYVYFYATLEEIPSDDEDKESEEEEDTTDGDTNYYLYRASINGATDNTPSFQLLGRATTKKRRS